jgi:hypothetical protein
MQSLEAGEDCFTALAMTQHGLVSSQDRSDEESPSLVSGRDPSLRSG